LIVHLDRYHAYVVSSIASVGGSTAGGTNVQSARNVMEDPMREERAKRKIEAILAASMPALGTTPRIVTLCYHSVHPFSGIRSATPAMFERQIEWLQDNCEIVPYSAIAELATSRPGGRPHVAITFDDGYEDNHRYAFPILESHGILATIFVTTGLADQDSNVVEGFSRSWGASADDVRGLSWAQISEMHSAGFDVGAHTRSHPILAGMRASEAREEIHSSKAAIEDHLGEAVKLFAYPFGKPRQHTSRNTRAIVAELGFESAAAILYRGVRQGEDPMSIPRFPITRDTMEVFSGKVHGRLDAIGLWQSYAPLRLSRLISTDPTQGSPRSGPADRVAAPPSDTLGRNHVLGLAPRWVALPWSRWPRWLVPRDPPVHARAGICLAQPVSLGGRIGWEAASALAGAGVFRHLRSYPLMPREAWEAAAPFIPRGGGVAVGKASRPGRFKALVLDAEGHPLVFIKVARDTFGARALMTERAALEGYGGLISPPLFVPEVVSHADGVLVLGALDWRPRLSPWRLPEEVAFALGVFFRRTISGAHIRGAAHGDFAPRNLLQIEGGWGLVDWAGFQREAPPFFDLFHYLIQAHTELRRPMMQAIQDGLKGEGWVGNTIAAYAAGAEIEIRDSPHHLREYLSSTVSRLDGSTPWRVRRLRSTISRSLER
jgi:peptidoglycan/xylan/chitin deacetylase (PgdA/CDA1 family)